MSNGSAFTEGWPGVASSSKVSSIGTARLFSTWRAAREGGPGVLAETSGKNAIVVTPSADVDLAVADLVRSAFGHAGQKCSAASLVVLVGTAGTSERLRRQLVGDVGQQACGRRGVGGVDEHGGVRRAVAQALGKAVQGRTRVGRAVEQPACGRQRDHRDGRGRASQEGGHGGRRRVRPGHRV